MLGDEKKNYQTKMFTCLGSVWGCCHLLAPVVFCSMSGASSPPPGSSPSRWNEDDTVGGIFFGALDQSKEAPKIQRLQHALLPPQHESRAPSPDGDPVPTDEVDDGSEPLEESTNQAIGTLLCLL